MSDYLPCVTNTRHMLDVRSCTVRDQHTDYCDGFEHRYREAWNPQLQRDVLTAVQTMGQTLPPCGGCLPRRAEHGLLCWSCWLKVEEALKIAPDMITHLRSVERAQQVDNGGIRTAAGWVFPIPQTWRTADELLMLLGAPAPGFPSTAGPDQVAEITEQWVHPDADLWVSSEAGAEAAVRFYRTMQNAMAQHPMAEYEHRIRNVPCYRCRQRTLLWKPPLAFEGDVHVVCTNEACGAEVDQTMFERLALLEETSRKTKPEGETA